MRMTTTPPISYEPLLRGEEWNPRAILGCHSIEEDGQQCVVVRTFQPQAQSVALCLSSGTVLSMTKLYEAGLFEARLAEALSAGDYRFKMTFPDGRSYEQHDPYAFPLQLTSFDLHLFAEGKLHRAYRSLGAHLKVIEKVAGVHFAVWAPNAKRVSVVGDFNNWDGRRYPMQNRGSGGLWELFLPGLREGDLYKYEILPQQGGVLLEKADPYASGAEVRPKTASRVCDLTKYRWQDQKWMTARPEGNPIEQPLSIYEVHLGSWMRAPEEGHRWLTYRELADKLVPYAIGLGFTHLELLPIMEHPFDGSWGYQTTGYCAATSRFGPPEDFMAFVDVCHLAGLGVILDWAPAHFPDDPHGLAWFDGSYLYDHEDPRLGFHPDWNSRIFNFGRREVRSFLISTALSWFDHYHIDGLRVDAVASMLYLDYSRKAGEWVPNQFGGNENLDAITFMKEFNEAAHGEYPGILTIAEESTAWPGVSRPTYMDGLGFSFKWNMGWMHDTLDYFALDPVYRQHHQNDLTFGLLYAFTENFVLVLSHDEVVHMKKSLLDKMQGDLWQRFANLRALYGYMFGHPGKKMLFMGGEIGQWTEWNHDTSLDWHLLQSESHQGVQRFVRDLNQLYRSQPALYQVDADWAGFQWIDFSDHLHSVLSFLRRARNPHDAVLCVYNLTPVPRHEYRIGVPSPGYYRELLNSDASLYGGTNVGNAGGVMAEAIPCHNQPYSVRLTLPPLGVLFLKAQ